MNMPSTKTLEREFPGKGKQLRLLLTSMKACRATPAAIALERQCYNAPTPRMIRLAAIDEALEGHGVEHVATGSNAQSEGFDYINMGDCYTCTIVRFNSGRYRVTDIGSIIERGNYE